MGPKRLTIEVFLFIFCCCPCLFSIDILTCVHFGIESNDCERFLRLITRMDLQNLHLSVRTYAYVKREKIIFQHIDYCLF